MTTTIMITAMMITPPILPPVNGLDVSVAVKVAYAVNVDGAIATVVLGNFWKALQEKRLTVRRVCDIAFSVFALGRVAGATGEYLDHNDYGNPMDMRIPARDCIALTRSRERRKTPREQEAETAVAS